MLGQHNGSVVVARAELWQLLQAGRASTSDARKCRKVLHPTSTPEDHFRDWFGPAPGSKSPLSQRTNNWARFTYVSFEDGANEASSTAYSYALRASSTSAKVLLFIRINQHSTFITVLHYIISKYLVPHRRLRPRLLPCSDHWTPIPQRRSSHSP